MNTSSEKVSPFRERLVYLRQMARLSQRQLALLSGVSQHTISSLEQGRENNPTLKTLVGLAGALGVQVETLIAGVNEGWWTT